MRNDDSRQDHPQPVETQEEMLRQLEAWKERVRSGADMGFWEDSELLSRAMKLMGAVGGSRRNPRKGFGSASPEKRREAALKGLAKRWGTIATTV